MHVCCSCVRDSWRYVDTMCRRVSERTCKIESLWEMRAFASRGQADGGYTTTERDLDGGRSAVIIKM